MESNAQNTCPMIMANGNPCGRAFRITSERLCIFHSKKHEEKWNVGLLDEFRKQLQQKIQQELADPSIKELDFTEYVFPANDFSNLKFNKSVIFSRAIFQQNVSFNKTEFTGEKTAFDGARFEGNTYFGNVEFNSGNNSFIDALFLGDTFFNRGTVFSGNLTSFGALNTGTIFNGKKTVFTDVFFRSAITSFIKAKFNSSEETNFDGTEFHGKVIDFSYSEFRSENVTFRKTKFISDKEDINFQNCWFKGLRTLFHDTTFRSNIVCFNDSVFDNNLDFRTSEQNNTQHMFDQGASLRRVIFLTPERVTFSHLVLTMVEFLGTDLRKINFVSVYWRPMKRFKWAKSGKLKPMLYSGTYDENLLSKKTPSPNEIELLKTEYRQLKQNYDENSDYTVADQFYVGEMEVTRQHNTPWYWKLFSWRRLYHFVSGYGTLPNRSLFILCFTLITFSAIYMFTGLKVNADFAGNIYYIKYELACSLPNLSTTLKDFLYCAWFGISGILPIKDSSQVFEPFTWTRVIQILETITVPILTAFFALALRRRFKR